MEMIRKLFSSSVKQANRETLTVEHFISTESVDRHGDIVRARGMKIKGKPVVLLQHGRGHMGAEPIAKPLKITRGEFKGVRGIVATTQFFPDDLGTRLFEKTADGFMPNWSIGFISLKSEPRRDDEGNPMEGRDIKEWELLEYSIVGVPAQPDAQTIPGKKDEPNKIAFQIIERKSSDGFGPDLCLECGGELVVEHGFEFPGGKDGPEVVTYCPACKEKAQEEETVEVPPDWEKEKWDEEWEVGVGQSVLLDQAGGKGLAPDLVEKPFPNEHACRLVDPAKYEKFRRQNNKFGEGVHAIWGIKAGKTELQAIRFDKAKFTVSSAKKWASDHDYRCIQFEPASGGKDAEIETLKASVAQLTETCQVLSEALIASQASIEEIRATLSLKSDDTSSPGEPAPGTDDGDGTGDPPDPPHKKRARVVFVQKTAEETRREKLVGVVAEALNEVIVQRYRKEILGKVD